MKYLKTYKLFENNSIFPNSKVVDEKGDLKIVYHGTKSHFTKFSTMGETDEGYYGKGYYFTDDLEYAKEYGKVVMECFLNITKPFTLVTDSSSDSDALLDLRDALSTLDGMPKDLKTIRTLPEGYYIHEDTEEHYGKNYTLYSIYPEEKYYGTDKEIYSHSKYLTKISAIVYFNDQLNNISYDDYGWSNQLLKSLDRDNLHNILIKNGYDGIYVTDWKTKEIDEYVVFEPEQIYIANSKVYENINKKIFVGYHCSDVDLENYDGEISEDYFDRYEDILKLISKKYPKAKQYLKIIQSDGIEYDSDLAKDIYEYFKSIKLNWIFVDEQEPLTRYGDNCYSVYFNNINDTFNMRDYNEEDSDYSYIYFYDEKNKPELKKIIK